MISAYCAKGHAYFLIFLVLKCIKNSKIVFKRVDMQEKLVIGLMSRVFTNGP